MIRKIYSLALSAVAALALTGCSDDTWKPDVDASAEGTGKLSTETLAVEVSNAEQVISDTPSGRAGIDLSNFIVKILDSKEEVVEQWTYGRMPSLPVFPVGSYKVVVYSHEQAEAAFSAPYFEGEQSFVIRKDEVTYVDPVVCKFANVKFTIKFTPELVAASAGDLKVTVRAGDRGVLVFTPDTNESGYFKAYVESTTYAVTFTGTVAGGAEEFTKPYTDLSAGQHRIITFSLREPPIDVPEETGKVDPTSGINVNTNVVDVDLTSSVDTDEPTLDDSDRPGKEDPVTPDPGPQDPVDPADPSESLVEFTSSTLDLEGVNNANGFEGDAIVNITSKLGLTHLYVTIDSDKLTPDVLEGVGLASEFDLAYPGDLEAGVAGLGFPYGNQVIGATSLEFNITQFVPLLNIYPGGTHNFILRAIDSQNKEYTLTLKFIS